MAMIEFLERLPLWLLAIVLNVWLMGLCSWVCGFSGATSFLACKSTSTTPTTWRRSCSRRCCFTVWSQR